MRTIDADDLKKTIKKELAEFSNWGEIFVPQAIDNAPTIEAFTREELETWLYTIAFNNIDGNEEDMKFAKHTEEIIRRLDGFERYVKDKREGKI